LFMKSFDFIPEDKVEALKKFCREHNPPINIHMEVAQKRQGQVRVVAETDTHNIVDYDDHLYLLKNGVERPKYKAVIEKPKKWYQFFK